ncbi:helix-turn-helix domain-containing protein [Streptomyces umbrinus]|uniref:helix-turn-helix domain-containing protein n=1 Tax=Streptomyces umbrinus TaxID=67370 RepID=UPI0033D14D36
MSSHASDEARVIPLRPVPAAPVKPEAPEAPAPKEPLWRDVVGDVLRRERLAQERTLKDVADAARISMPYLSELERGRKEASSEVLAAAAHALGLGLADLLALAHGRLARPAQPLRSRPLTSQPLRSGSRTASRRTEARSRLGDIRLAA